MCLPLRAGLALLRVEPVGFKGITDEGGPLFRGGLAVAHKDISQRRWNNRRSSGVPLEARETGPRAGLPPKVCAERGPMIDQELVRVNDGVG